MTAVDTFQKNYPEAEKVLTALVKEHPDNALIHQQLGIHYQARGLTQRAEASLLRALELDPSSTEILQSTVRFYTTVGLGSRAIEIINKSVPDAQKQAINYEWIGQAYAQGGKLQEAEAAYKNALQKEPGRGSTYEQLARLYLQAGRLDDSMKALDEVLKKNPSDAKAYTTKGTIAERKGDLSGAKEYYGQALKIDPNSSMAANNLAYILAEEGRDLEVALRWAQEARRMEPENANSADTLGWVHHKLGRNVLARDQLRFAVGKEPENPIFQYHLGMIYIESKQIREAEAALKKAVASSASFKEKDLAAAALKNLSVKR
jgi:Flp pilus assembly protein TadD